MSPGRHGNSSRGTYRGGGRGRGRDSRGGRGRDGGGGSREGRNFFRRPVDPRRQGYTNTSKETLAVLPDILKELPHLRADESELWSLDALPPLASANLFSLDVVPTLKASSCPKHPKKAVIKVINEDSYNAALQLAASVSPTSAPSAAASGGLVAQQQDISSRVAVLNLASHKDPGGGWLNGAMAQEEALCYRSSLYLSLHKRYYKLRELQGIYTRDVVIIRSALSAGHELLLGTPGFSGPADLPVVSVLSVAALRSPKRKTVRLSGAQDDAAEDDEAAAQQDGGDDGGDEAAPAKGQQQRKKSAEMEIFADPEDRELTKKKMRLCLRMAAIKGHDLLVLGALGCGAFKNPTEDVAQCWAEVLREAEFQGGWWREIWFAVYDRKREGNFEVFEEVLGGMEV